MDTQLLLQGRPTRGVTVSGAVSTITCRWEITIMIVLQAVMLHLFGESVAGASVSVPGLLTAAVFGLCAQGLCSVLNDITDLRVDEINHPERPLPSGRATLPEAWTVVGLCFAGAVTSAALLATTPFALGMFALHLLLSLLYSAPGVRFGRHWLMGPLTLATSTVCFILAILGSSSLYSSAGPGPDVVLLVGGVCLAHYLLVIPLKDIRDMSGDASGGGTSLAMKVPRRWLIRMGVLGYTVPWGLLSVGMLWLTADGDPLGLSGPFHLLAVVFVLAGVLMAWLVRFRPELLVESQRFCWFAELGLLFLFQVSLPLALFATGAAS